MKFGAALKIETFPKHFTAFLGVNGLGVSRGRCSHSSKKWYWSRLNVGESHPDKPRCGIPPGPGARKSHGVCGAISVAETTQIRKCTSISGVSVRGARTRRYAAFCRLPSDMLHEVLFSCHRSRGYHTGYIVGKSQREFTPPVRRKSDAYLMHGCVSVRMEM